MAHELMTTGLQARDRGRSAKVKRLTIREHSTAELLPVGRVRPVVRIADVGPVHGGRRGVGWRGRSWGAPAAFPPSTPPLLRPRLTRRRPSQFPTFTAHYWHTDDFGESWHLHEMEGACE